MYTVTVIIPARNEAHNLPELLSDICTQQLGRGVKMEKILVYSDGSTDTTVNVVKSMAKTDSRIAIRSFYSSKGKAARLNQAFSNAKTDAVIVLDADIQLPHSKTLQRLLLPIRTKGADLTSATVAALDTNTWVEKMLALSMTAKQRAYAQWKQGNNLYTCHGRVRAFSGALYSNIQFQHSYNEDSFSYLYCQTHGYSYQFVPETTITYRLPKTLHDHILQSERFFVSTDLLHRSFPESVVQQELALPKKLLFAELIRAAVQQPILMTAYVLVTLYTAIHARLSHDMRANWQIASTSK